MPHRFTYTSNHADVDFELATPRLFNQIKKMLYAFFPTHFFCFFTCLIYAI